VATGTGITLHRSRYFFF